MATPTTTTTATNIKPPLPAQLKRSLKHLGHYGLYALAGLVLDILVFVALQSSGMATFNANLWAGSSAATLVYFATAQVLFNYQGAFLWPKWGAYVGYIALALLVASALIAWLATHTPLPPLLCKLLLIPGQFLLNYAVLGQILKAFEAKR